MDQIEQIGALLGLAAFLGLAVLVLLYFQQARDVRRLREWAGRAPERAEAAAEEAMADAAKEAGLEPDEEEAPPPGEEAPLRERLLSRLPAAGSWRERLPYIAIIAVGVVLVGVGVATGAFGLLGDEDGQGGKKDRPTKPSDIEVAVLNGTAVAGSPGIAGLAEAVAKEVKSDGYKVGEVGDAGSFADTLAMYRGGRQAEAELVADDLSKLLEDVELQKMTDEIKPVAGDADVAVIIGQNNSQLE